MSDFALVILLTVGMLVFLAVTFFAIKKRKQRIEELLETNDTEELFSGIWTIINPKQAISKEGSIWNMDIRKAFTSKSRYEEKKKNRLYAGPKYSEEACYKTFKYNALPKWKMGARAILILIVIFVPMILLKIVTSKGFWNSVPYTIFTLTIVFAFIAWMATIYRYQKDMVVMGDKLEEKMAALLKDEGGKAGTPSESKT